MNSSPRSHISENGINPLRSSPIVRFIPILLIVIIFATYFSSLSHPFVFDDVPELVHNPDVLRLSGCLDTISRSQNTGLSGRPVACLTFAANVTVAGFSVRAFHLVNIAIHILAAVTLFGILRRTIIRVQPSINHSVSVLAAFITLCWALHPLQTESVTYIIQRIESLAGLWYLLTLYCAIRAWGPDKPGLWGVLSVASCALGMLTKEIVVTAPLIVLLFDKVFMHRAMNNAPRRKIRLHLGLAATWIIPIALNITSPRGGSAGFGLGVTALDYLRTQAGVIVHYLRLSFWPFPQAISYSDWPIVRDWGPSMAPGLLIVLLLLITIVGLINRKWWGFCGAWFFLILAPSSSIVPIVTEPAAERRMYLPLAAVVTATAVIFLSANRAMQISNRTRRAISIGISSAAILGLSTATVFRNAEYATAVRILASTLEVRPGDELVRGALVEELVREERIDEAERIHQEGIARNPQSYILFDNWARTLSSIGRHEEAIEAFSQALKFRPGHYPARAGLGVALVQAGRHVEAIGQFEEAVRLAPNAYSIRGNMAVALAALGRTDEAIRELRTAIELKPSFADGHFNLARLLASQGHTDEAMVHLRIAAELRPEDAEVQRTLAEILQRQGSAIQAPGG